MRRVISLWLNRWPTDRASRTRGDGRGAEPLVTFASGHGGLRLVAVNAAAAAAGLRPGLGLADARAIDPGLCAVATDPVDDAQALARLAAWCERFTPWVATDGQDGLWLEVTGCTHLFGGEAALLARLSAALAGRRISHRLALADTPGAAWALARHHPMAGGPPWTIAPADDAPTHAHLLARLPVAALRVEGATVGALGGLGLTRIGDILALPRAALARRFGPTLLTRVDQITGRTAEPITPDRAPPPVVARLAFVEPVAAREPIVQALERLLADLCRTLAAGHLGARRVVLTLVRIDGGRPEITVGTGRPTRRPEHLARLFALHLDSVALGFGVEEMRLAAPVVEPLGPEQAPLMDGADARTDGRQEAGAEALAELIDRLSARAGAARLVRPAVVESHLPERAVAYAPATAASPAAATWADAAARPLRLLPRPEPVAAVAPLPDDPPVLFRWRGDAHRVVAADGPERIAAEWWRAAASAQVADADAYRDYYRVEDTTGARFWLYRAGPYRPATQGMRAEWYLHGLFA